MPSRVISENEFIRIWIDEFTPLIYAQLRVVPSNDEQLSIINESKLSGIRFLFKKYGIAYSIFDTSETPDFAVRQLVGYFNFCLTEQLEAGLAYKAFLKPDDLLASIALDEVVKNLRFKEVGVFNTFDKAVAHVKDLWRAHVNNLAQLSD